MSTPTTTNTYGFLPNNAIKRTAQSASKFFTGIAYPLAKSRTKKVFGDVKNVNNVDYFAGATDIELIQGMLRQLFLTKKGERVMNPLFGLSLQDYMFEQLDLTTFEIMRADIIDQLGTFFPFLEVIKLNIYEANSTIAENGLIVKLTARMRDVNLLPSFDFEVNVG